MTLDWTKGCTKSEWISSQVGFEFNSIIPYDNGCPDRFIETNWNSEKKEWIPRKCNPEVNKEGYYLIDSNDSEGKVITKETIGKCTEENLCDLYKCDNTGVCDLPTESITGYVLYRVDNDKIMMECTDNNCIPVTVNPGYYDSAIPEEYDQYMIKCIMNSDNNVECDLINIDSLKCKPEKNKEGYYLIDNNDSEGKVITKETIDKCTEENLCDLYKCDNNGNCDLPTESITGYVLYSVDDDKIIMECINNKCLPVTVNPGYYVDGYSAISENAYVRLIKCNNDVESCEVINNPIAGQYINAIPNKDDYLKEALIKCEGTTEITCQVIDADVNNVYINNDNSNLIKCFSTGCSNYQEEWNDDKPKYYVNSAISANPNYEKLLIKCNYTNKCKEENSIENGVYINSNFGTDSDTDYDPKNQLIVCKKNGDTNKECILKEVEIGNGNHAIYYKNYGEYIDNSNVHALIKCTENSGTSCTPFMVTVGNGNPSDVFYINANNNIDGKYLIQCISVESCNVYSNLNSIVDVDEYYIHGDPISGSYTDTIIKCTITSTGTTCLYLNEVMANQIYINSADGNLIRCNESNQCLASTDIGISTQEIPSYFINAKGISVNGVNKLLIHCLGSGTCKEYVPAGSGYYFNKDNTAIACIKDQECVETTDHNYITDTCNDEHLGLIVKEAGKDLYLCSSVDIDKSSSGVYITRVSNNNFPGTPTKGLISIEYNSLKNTLIKADTNANDPCTKDGQIILKDESYYYCTNVTIHETYESDGVTLNNELTRYESQPISLNSVGSTFVINFGSEYKVVHIEENGKTTINYDKGYYLDRSGRTIKYIKGSLDDDGNEIIETIDPNSNMNTKVIQCNGESCTSITVEDKDFYENSERKYVDESSATIQCNQNSNNAAANQYIECTIKKSIASGYYTNAQKELIHCSEEGCTTTEPKDFEEIANVIPKYYMNGNSRNDASHPIIICKYSMEDEEENRGCRVGKPFREVFLDYDLTDQQDYPITFTNVFVNSGAVMSLISCDIVLRGSTEDQASYQCNLIQAEEYSYYITSESEAFSEDESPKASLIECTTSADAVISSCKEYEKGKLGPSYYINAQQMKKIIGCQKGGCISKFGVNYYIEGCSRTAEDINNGMKVNCYESVSELIDCSGNNSSSSSKCKTTVGNRREFYIKGDGEGLIRCENDTCEEIEGNEQEVFMNGSSKEKGVKPIIIYEDEKWRSQTVLTNNALYLNGNRGRNEKGACKYSFIHCTGPTECSEISGESGKKYINVESAVVFTCDTEEVEEEKKLQSKNILEYLSPERYFLGFIVNPTTMEILSYSNDSGVLVVCAYDGSKVVCSTKKN